MRRMSVPNIAGILADRFGFAFTPEQVRESGRTETVSYTHLTLPTIYSV